jgi:putative flippase GtrA
MILTNTKERIRFFRFAVVGLIGAVVDFAILNILLLFSTPYVLAGTISFIMAVFNNFLWNRFWTYPDSRSKKVTNQLLQFGIINAIGLLIRIPLLAVLEKFLINLAAVYLPDHFLSPEFVGHNTGLAIVITIVMFWNFLANRYWTYSDVKS